jgi:hypothetical protein
MRGLLSAGTKPEILEIESFGSYEDLMAGEIYWIAQFMAMGAKLTNACTGGIGSPGYRHSEETKAKWRKNRSGVNAPKYGMKWSAEQAAHMSAYKKEWYTMNPHPLLGKPRSDETKEKLRAAKLGVKMNLSDEAKANMALARRKNWDNPQYRLMMSRPGLLNQTAKRITVDGVDYCMKDISRMTGHSPSTVSARAQRIMDSGKAITMDDFMWTRSRKLAAKNPAIRLLKI